jgi:energy-coupling factor transporter transmembrane protein EcfT
MTQRGFNLFVLLLMTVVVIVIAIDTPPFVVTLTVGGPILIIYGSWRIGRRRRWSRWQRIAITLVGLALWALWAYSPHFIVPPQPKFSPSEASLAAKAEQQVREKLDSWNDWVVRMDVTQVVQGPEKDQVCVVGYTLFYLPVFRYEVYWYHSGPVSGGGTRRPWPWPCLR